MLRLYISTSLRLLTMMVSFVRYCKGQLPMHRKRYWRSEPHIRHRARQLRHVATDAETLLWQHLRMRSSTGLKWRRQHPIGRFIVDFYCAEYQLIVELDGSVHDQQVERDAERTTLLERAGYRVLRVRNQAIEANVHAVVDCINAWIAETGRVSGLWGPHPRCCATTPTRKRGCPRCGRRGVITFPFSLPVTSGPSFPRACSAVSVWVGIGYVSIDMPICISYTDTTGLHPVLMLRSPIALRISQCYTAPQRVSLHVDS
jgi:very-short-patch-repair endonuclease